MNSDSLVKYTPSVILHIKLRSLNLQKQSHDHYWTTIKSTVLQPTVLLEQSGDKKFTLITLNRKSGSPGKSIMFNGCALREAKIIHEV